MFFFSGRVTMVSYRDMKVKYRECMHVFALTCALINISCVSNSYVNKAVAETCYLRVVIIGIGFTRKLYQFYAHTETDPLIHLSIQTLPVSYKIRKPSKRLTQTQNFDLNLLRLPNFQMYLIRRFGTFLNFLAPFAEVTYLPTVFFNTILHI